MRRVHDGFRYPEKAGHLRGIDTSVVGIEETSKTVFRWVGEALSAKAGR